MEKAIEQEIKESTPISLLQCTSNFPSINVKWNAWLIYSVLKKWSTKLYVFPSSGQFKKSYPMVSPKGILAVTQDVLEYLDHDGVVAVADDLNDIDALIEGFIEEELEELDEL